MGQYLCDFESIDLANLPSFAPNIAPRTKKGVTFGEALPELSEVASTLPVKFMDEVIPENFKQAVCVLYANLASESMEGFVRTDELMFEISDFLRLTAYFHFEMNMEGCLEDKDRLSFDIDAMAEDYFFDLLEGDLLYSYAFEIMNAIQEAEGLMTYNVLRDGSIIDIIAPVQCGVMDLFD